MFRFYIGAIIVRSRVLHLAMKFILKRSKRHDEKYRKVSCPKGNVNNFESKSVSVAT